MFLFEALFANRSRLPPIFPRVCICGFFQKLGFAVSSRRVREQCFVIDDVPAAKHIDRGVYILPGIDQMLRDKEKTKEE